MSHVLVTGGTGCIGGAAVRALIDRGEERVTVVCRSGGAGALDLWFPDGLDERIEIVRADVSDREAVAGLLADVRPTRIIHLAAFQSPDCDAQPLRGLEINVGGTMHMLAAAATCAGLERFVFASSAAVYGQRSMYSGPTVKEDDPLAPPNLYGVWKRAGEHLARQFHERTGVPTVCLRLNTTYGKGRDRGTTSAPTTAMKAVALGAHRGKAAPFRMPYRGRENYHFVADVGADFAICALEPFEGFGAFNIPGRTIEVTEMVRLIVRLAGELGMGETADLDVASDAKASRFVCDLDDGAIRRAFPSVPLTSLEDGVRLSLAAFRDLAAAGKLWSLP